VLAFLALHLPRLALVGYIFLSDTVEQTELARVRVYEVVVAVVLKRSFDDHCILRLLPVIGVTL
jgi:hypothetical protein